MNRLFSDAWWDESLNRMTELQAISPTGGPINTENCINTKKNTRGTERCWNDYIQCSALILDQWPLWKFSVRPGDERTAMDSFHHVGQQRQRHSPEPKLGIQHSTFGRRPIFKDLVSLWVLKDNQTNGKTEYTHKDHKGSQGTKVRIIENCAEKYPTPGRIECLDVGKFGEPDAPHKVMVSKLPFAVQSLGSPS